MVASTWLAADQTPAIDLKGVDEPPRQHLAASNQPRRCDKTQTYFVTVGLGVKVKRSGGAKVSSTVASELAQVMVPEEWGRPTWRKSWQDGTTREALIGRATALGGYRVGARVSSTARSSPTKVAAPDRRTTREPRRPGGKPH